MILRMFNEELLEALCQKTKLFCGPWGRLLQYPQLRTYQKSVKSVVLFSDSPHSFHIRSTFRSTILFDFDGIPMASRESQWYPNGIPSILHVDLHNCSRLLGITCLLLALPCLLSLPHIDAPTTDRRWFRYYPMMSIQVGEKYRLTQGSHSPASSTHQV